ncbi:NAD(P)-dependent oxidoreductase [Tropicimonas sp. IMCC34011]|uniref:NAD-dependent epimerase/dehydratase family protein n=1 Tax=Tropicimonas sp. IMCC34011 TaxID=2248759 RepID=UPI0018E57609|nr:NAD-dependent epimerase/dehydratase family protein [Tropicimonas sp. IMCC34011]
MPFDGPVIVTGATGFLGGAVLRRLAVDGIRAVGIGRDRGRLGGLASEGFEVRTADLTRPEEVRTALSGGARALVHCAALSAPFGPRAAFERANVVATRNVLAAAREAGTRRVVHISTPSVAFRMADQIGLREDAPLPRAINHYAATKAVAERLVLESPDLGPVILRPRGIYGAGDTALLPRLLRAAATGPLPELRDGAARIDLTHVEDVVSAVLAALRAGPAAEGKVVNVSGGEVLPVRTIVEAAAGHAGIGVRWRKMPLGPVLAAARLSEAAARITRREPRVTRYSAGLFAYAQSLDLSRAATLLGWRPGIPFAEGLERTFR